MKKKTLSMLLAGLIFLSSGCATPIKVYHEKDTFEGCKICTVYRGKVDKLYYSVDLLDKNGEHHYVHMDENGKGREALGTNVYDITFIDARHPEDWGLTFEPAGGKR